MFSNRFKKVTTYRLQMQNGSLPQPVEQLNRVADAPYSTQQLVRVTSAARRHSAALALRRTAATENTGHT
jgi:hypothetical protein